MQSSCAALPASFPLGTRSYFLEVKQLDHDIDHTPPSRREIKNAWSYIFTPLTYSHGMARASSHLPIAAFLFEVSVLVSLWHIQSSITKAQRRPKSLSCRSSEMWRCALGWIVHPLEGYSGKSSPRTQRLIHPTKPWGTAVLLWQHHIPEGSELKCQSSVGKNCGLEMLFGGGVLCYGTVDCVTVKWKPECMFIYLFMPLQSMDPNKIKETSWLQNPSVLCICACW